MLMHLNNTINLPTFLPAVLVLLMMMTSRIQHHQMQWNNKIICPRMRHYLQYLKYHSEGRVPQECKFLANSTKKADGCYKEASLSWAKNLIRCFNPPSEAYPVIFINASDEYIFWYLFGEWFEDKIVPYQAQAFPTNDNVLSLVYNDIHVLVTGKREASNTPSSQYNHYIIREC